MAGTLYLIPVPLGPTPLAESLPASVLSAVRPLAHFIVEQPKSARAFLKAVATDVPLQELQLAELNEHTQPEALERLLLPLRAGHDVGLISEAGCPAVADPGANLVALAHQEHIRVTPLIGPSSLLVLPSTAIFRQRKPSGQTPCATSRASHESGGKRKSSSKRLTETSSCSQQPCRSAIRQPA